VSPSRVVLLVLAAAVLVTTPGLLSAFGWALSQPWINIPALLLAAAWTWKPAHTKRALLIGAALAHQHVSQRRQTKTATA
jgi:hypothetical protein